MAKRKTTYEEVKILTLYKMYKLQMEVNLSQLKLLQESKKYVTNLLDRKKMDTIALQISELEKYQAKVMELYKELAAAIYKFTYTELSTASFRIVLVEYLMKDKSLKYISKRFGLSEDTILHYSSDIKKKLLKINVSPYLLV